ncbi:hypothetical protein BV25DRAFT_270200 [Artomyces pyxidatus]|uniref:Uncharacterized protein n=1 Tax=Artomyces pyxidatus TaxID=48021 RepID=A0ACB8T829_9AGAM|nr:hypothetical protein BV25DRAFT_270200 [Artomyces pyxidatus]
MFQQRWGSWTGGHVQYVRGERPGPSGWSRGKYTGMGALLGVWLGWGGGWDMLRIGVRMRVRMDVEIGVPIVLFYAQATASQPHLALKEATMHRSGKRVWPGKEHGALSKISTDSARCEDGRRSKTRALAVRPISRSRWTSTQ